jgi:hypothetical protein
MFFLSNHIMKKIIFTFLLLGIMSSVFAQNKFTLSGYLKDAKSGETLIGATVYVKELSTGTISNVYGFYSISLDPGDYTITYSYVSYTNVEKIISLTENIKMDIELAEISTELTEIVVTGEAEDENISSVQMSVNKLDIQTIQKMPALFGEVDIIRSIQLLPGVSTVGEGATGFNVRGGGVGQNLVLLDEAPVYNSSHLFGFFSIFNPDAVKDVKLLRGGIPAQYGGRLSSILDVRMKEGNNKQFAASGGVGAIFSRLTLEAPIVKDKASFILAGRRSYIDVLAKPFLGEDLKNSKFNFYDLTAKANWNINDNNRIYLSGYLGRDVFNADNVFASDWGNATTSFRWNHLFNDRLFSNVTVFYSNYDYRLAFGEGEDTFDWKSRIINYSVKPELTFYANPKNVITFGGQATLYEFDPGKAVGQSAGEVTNIALDKKYALEGALYLGNEQTVTNWLSLSYGLRFSYFNYMGEGNAYSFGESETTAGRKPVTGAEVFNQWESIETYQNFEPRFAFNLRLNPSSSIKLGYNRMAQYIHLVSNTVASTPLDIWTPSTNNIRPTLLDQISLGFFKNFKDNMYEFSVETYYKDYQDVVGYIDNADLLLNEFIEGDLLRGDGRAYGVEFYLKKAKGKFNGWISYTLARTEERFDGINRDEWYAARFDQTHNLNVVAFYDLNKRWSFSANFVIVSGTPATFPTARFEFQGIEGVPQNSEERRNNYRIPVYHRLDLSATLQGKRVKKNGKTRKNEDYLVFSLYNAYNRRNPFSINFQNNPNNQSQTQAVRLSVVGSFIPSVSYNFKF